MKEFKLIFWLMFITSACSRDNDSFIGNDCIIGQGIITSEARSFVDFHSINNLIFADINLSQGPQEEVIFEAQQNILDIVKTQIADGELRIFHEQCIDIIDPVIVHITIPDIKSLALTGVGNVTTQTDFELTDLTVRLVGVGDFNLRGTAETLDIRITGVGDVKAFDLNANICSISISGNGDVEAYVNDELDVSITGLGNVFYKGNPTITSTISGAGEIVNSN